MTELTNGEQLVVKITVISFALQTLMAKLAAANALDRQDLIEMRELSLTLAEDLRMHSNIDGKKMASRLPVEIYAWWDPVFGMSNVNS